MFPINFSQLGLRQDNTGGSSKELKNKELVVDFFFFFLSDEWGMKGL